MKSRITPVSVSKIGTIVANIVNNDLGIPQNSTLHIFTLLVKKMLCWLLVAVWILWIWVFYSALYILTNIKRSIASIFVPPLDKFFVVSCRVTNLPIELWHTIIAPPLVNPLDYIGIEVIVVLKSLCVRTCRRNVLVSENTKRRNTKFNPWLYCVNRIRKLFHENINIMTTPVITIGKAIVITFEVVIIGNHIAWCWVWIEIIVNMKSIDVVTTNDIGCHTADIFAVLRQCRIKNKLIVIREHTFRVLDSHMTVG